MKLKLTQPGYESFTGLLGITEFKDGVTVGDITNREARQIGLAIKAEWEDGTDPNPAQALLDAMNNVVEDLEVPKAEDELKSKLPTEYTREQLEEIADQKGIAGVREVGDVFGVKGKSIVEIIDGIMNAQQKAATQQ